ncbi:MAG: DUF2219 family protein [Leptospira sp.]|nr:DUF2219 family protein [Leptospira sp.]
MALLLQKNTKVFLVLLLLQTSLASQSISKEPPKELPRVFLLHWENDVFLFSDREYTNGTSLQYGHFQKSISPSAIILRGFGFILPFWNFKNQEYHNFGFKHSIYTPLNLYTSDASYGERPYSAFGLISSSSSYTWDRSTFSIETAFGQMGPSVQGKFFQDIIHKFTQSAIPQGWDNQIPQRNLYQINAQWKYFFTPYFGIQTNGFLGNLETSAGIGPIFRFGKISSPTLSGNNLNEISTMYQSNETEYFFYFKPSIKTVWINGTLGGTGTNNLTTIISPTDSQGILINDGRTLFIGEPFYNSVLQEGGSSAIYRYLVYQRSVEPGSPFGLNFLVFNTIFNGASVPEGGLKIYLLQSLIESNIDYNRYPGLAYFLYDTLFRDRTTGVSSYSKLLAYQYFFTNGITDADSTLLTAIVLYNDSNSSQTYKVDLNRWQGRFSTGYVYQTPEWFFQLGLEITSLEYKGSAGVTPFHRYTSIQIGKKF